MSYCRELEAFGVTYVWHNFVKGNQSMNLVSNKAWAQRFVEGDCKRFDIVNHYIFDRGVNFFRWSDTKCMCTPEQIALMNEREEDFHLFNGLTISLEHHTLLDGKYVMNYRECLSLATNSRTYDLPEFCLENYGLLRRYLSKLSHHSVSLMKESHFLESNVILNDEEPGDLMLTNQFN